MLVGRFQLDAVAGLAFSTAVDAFAALDVSAMGTCTTEAKPDDPGNAMVGAEAHAEAEPVAARVPVPERREDVQTRLPDTRSRGQRQADALAAMARAALRHAPGAAGDRPHILVTATVEQVAAAQAGAATTGPVSNSTTPEPPTPNTPTSTAAGPTSTVTNPTPTSLTPSGPTSTTPTRKTGRVPHTAALSTAPGWATGANAQPLSPRTLATLLCDSVLIRVLRGPRGAVLDLGRGVRTASAPQRKALAARDGGCAIPGCSVPAVGCEAHHVTWWSRGGPTDVANMALLCPRHHANVHQGHWSVEMRDGVPWVTAPRWVDPEQRPRRNTSFDLARRATSLAQQLLLSLDPAPPRPPPRPPLWPPDDRGRGGEEAGRSSAA
jgi:hypothetical protein